MSARLLLVRHGQTRWHAENRYAGTSEVELTQRGVAQAGQLADYLRQVPAGNRPTAVYSSPQGRALRTAEPSAEALGLPLQVVPDLAEVHFGLAEGRTRDELRAENPECVDRFLADPVTGAFPGAEPPEDAAERGTAALRWIAADRDEQGPTLVVAHNTLLRLCLCRLLGVPLRSYRTVFPLVANAAITEIEIDGEATGLLRLNHSARGGHAL